MSAPEPVTKRRRFKAVVFFEVDETPDPEYDVAAHEELVDKLYVDVKEALEDLQRAVRRSVDVGDIFVDEYP